MILFYEFVFFTCLILANAINTQQEIEKEHVHCRICGNTIANYEDFKHISVDEYSNSRYYDENHKDLQVDSFLLDSGETIEVVEFSRITEHSIQKVLEQKLQTSSHFPNYQFEQIYCSKCNLPIGTHYIQYENKINQDDSQKNEQEDNKIDTNESMEEEFDPNQEIHNEPDKQVETIIENTYQSVGCLEYTQTYWSYEICNKKEINQYHFDSTKKLKEPIYSLGVFQDKQDYDMGYMTYNEKNYKYYSHIYDDGQHSDETNAPRSTELHYIACSSVKPISVVSFIEDPICHYIITICIPTLQGTEYFKVYKPSISTVIKDEFFMFPISNIILDNDSLLKPIQDLNSYSIDIQTTETRTMDLTESQLTTPIDDVSKQNEQNQENEL